MKNLSIYLFALMIMLALLPLKAQLKSYDLSTYKLPEVTLNTLDFSLNVNEGSSSRTSFNSDTYDYSSYNETSTFNYSSYVNRVNLQRNLTTSLSLPCSWSKRVYSDSESPNFKIAPSLVGEFMNRYFFNSKMYLENSINVAYRYTLNKSKYINEDYSSVTKSSSTDIYIHDVTTRLPVKLGWGRIEQVQYARKAIYILEELQKQGRGSADISEEQITRFADLIARLQNTRIFDARLYQIEAIDSLNSFLVDENIVSLLDAKYFATLIDMFSYGQVQVRKSGSSFGFRLDPGYILQHNKEEGANDYTETSYLEENSMEILSLGAGLEYELEKPLSQEWQYSMKAEGAFEQNWAKNKSKEVELGEMQYDNSVKIHIPNLELGVSQTLGFYPNTRTDMRLNFDLKYIKLFEADQDRNNENFNGDGFFGNLGLEINYYISPKIRLTASSSVYYLWQDIPVYLGSSFSRVLSDNIPVDVSATSVSSNPYKKRFGTSFNISLSYALF